MKTGLALSRDSLLISRDYLSEQEKQHESPDYGTTGRHFLSHVLRVAEGVKATSILDYGCGKKTLEKALNQHWKFAPVCEVISYDPGVTGCNDRSALKTCDLVACIDVMEHIEPECVDNVLDEIRSLTGKAAFFTIANRDAARILSDGRNAHINQRPYTWWIQKLASRFRIKAFENMDKEDDREFWFILDHPR